MVAVLYSIAILLACGLWVNSVVALPVEVLVAGALVGLALCLAAYARSMCMFRKATDFRGRLDLAEDMAAAAMGGLCCLVALSATGLLAGAALQLAVFLPYVLLVLGYPCAIYSELRRQFKVYSC